MKITKILTFCSLLLVTILALPDQSFAQRQRSDDSLLEALENFFKQDYLSFGMLLQSQGEFHWDPDAPGQNSFRIPTARFKVYGELDGNFSYQLQTDMTQAPAILDAKIRYAFSDRFALTAGAQKPGISAEYLLPASGTDFINRSRIVSMLAQNRDVGLLAETALSSSIFLSGGIFNGTNQNLENNNNHFYYTGRLELQPELGEDINATLGFNIGHGMENGTSIGNGRLPAINGKRTMYGGDVRLEISRFLLSAELLSAELEYNADIDDNVDGYHITGGYWATDNLQLLARYDHIDSDFIFFENPDLVLGGLNYIFTDAASFQLSYQVDPDEASFGNHLLLAQLQIVF